MGLFGEEKGERLEVEVEVEVGGFWAARLGGMVVLRFVIVVVVVESVWVRMYIWIWRRCDAKGCSGRGSATWVRS